MQLRDAIIADGVIEPMGLALDNADKNSSSLRNIAWCLSNLHKGAERADFTLISASIPYMARALIRTELDVVCNDICWALSFFTQEGTTESLQCLLYPELVSRLMQLIEHPNIQIAVPAMRIVGNITSSSDPTVASVAIN